MADGVCVAPMAAAVQTMALLPSDDDQLDAGPLDLQGDSRRELGHPPRLRRRLHLRVGGSLLASAAVAAAIAFAARRGQGAPAPLDAVAIEAEAKSDEKADPKGCCSFGGHTRCAKPWENCQQNMGKACCTGTTSSVADCEKCKGEWITLPQSVCGRGHSLERPLPHIWNYSKPGKKKLHVRILTYNLFWWHLFVKNHGEGGKAGKLINKTAADMPYDIMAFQECQNPYHVLFDAGMDKTFQPWRTHMNTCIAYRKEAWKLLGKGTKIVANDGNVPGQHFGTREAMWLRLRHKKTKEIVFFMNHHGPLPLSSGGQWGAPATAYNLLHLIEKHAKKGEAAFVVGDFNSNAKSETITQMSCGIHKVFSGTKFGGVDHIFSNLDKSRVVGARPIGQGGSDHEALSAIFALGPKED